MNRLIIATICIVIGVGAYAQGLVSFGNDLAINDANGTPLGAPFQTELYVGTSATSVSPIVSSITAFIGNGFFFNNNPVAVPNIAAGQKAFLGIAVWNPADGATYEEAITKVGAQVGDIGLGTAYSGGRAAIQVRLCGLPPPEPCTLSGVGGFNLSVVVPEPSVISLGLIGLGGLLLEHRKKGPVLNGP